MYWETGACKLAKAVPPPEVQTQGCEAWVLTDCPF
jgi:hypothetical protein